MEIVLSILSAIFIVQMIILVAINKEYSFWYKIIMLCAMITAYSLFLYGLFFSTKFEDVNDFIMTIGLSITCSVWITSGLIISTYGKRSDKASLKTQEWLHCFYDTAHILILYIVILCNL